MAEDNKGSELYAEEHEVFYRWPEDDEWKSAYIVLTNIDDYEKASEIVGIPDDYILVYTDTLDEEEIEACFDGLKIVF